MDVWFDARVDVVHRHSGWSLGWMLGLMLDVVHGHLKGH